MNVLVGCELSGRVRDAFRDRGHAAWSCDLKGPDDQEWYLYPNQRHPQFHLVGDILKILQDGPPGGGRWHLLIAFPPCTYLTRAGLHWNSRVPGRNDLTDDALDFVRRLMAADVERIAIENPYGRIATATRPPDQIINPYEFGDDASKATCLWLKNLAALVIDPALRVPGRVVEWPRGTGKMVERWSNQADSGQHLAPPGRLRSILRATTHPGVASAMALNWS